MVERRRYRGEDLLPDVVACGDLDLEVVEDARGLDHAGGLAVAEIEDERVVAHPVADRCAPEPAAEPEFGIVVDGGHELLHCYAHSTPPGGRGQYERGIPSTFSPM